MDRKLLAWTLMVLGSAFAVVAGAMQPLGCAHDKQEQSQRASEQGAAASEMSGMFVYYADAALITLCANGRQLPVAMEGDYRALESAYLAQRAEPQQALLVSLQGKIVPRPSPEETQPPRDSVIVERFLGMWPRETCDTPGSDSPLGDTHWRLVRLLDRPAAYARQTEPHLVFDVQTGRVSGSGGCNQLLGGFEQQGERLKFKALASTMMACPEGMDQEVRLLQSLERVELFRLRGNHLDLLDAQGAMIARFEATPRPHAPPTAAPK